jgi:hypothetical protein
MGAERYVTTLNIEVSVHANSGEIWVFKTIPRMIIEGSGKVVSDGFVFRLYNKQITGRW